MTSAAGESADDSAEDLAAVLGSLLDDLRFVELEQALRCVDQLRGPARRRALQLCRAGHRLLELDAVEFAGVPDMPRELQGAVDAMHFPRTPGAVERGSLQSLEPLYALMLEALGVHWERREMAHVVLILHLIAEYLPLLAWEPELGHAADPLRLRLQVSVPGSLWATPQCPMPRHRRSAAERVLAMDPDSTGGGIHPEQWQVYLNKWHARVSGALRQCARRPGSGRPNPEDGGCDRRCSVVDRLGSQRLGDLAARMALASVFAESPVVSLRHSAPVGHFFGVPDTDEVLEAWQETRERLCRPWRSPPAAEVAGGEADLREPPAVNPVASGLVEAAGEPLPGLQHMISTVAARPVQPSRLLGALRDEVSALLQHLIDPIDGPADTPDRDPGVTLPRRSG